LIAKCFGASVRAIPDPDDGRIPEHRWTKPCGRRIDDARVHRKRQAWEGEAQYRHFTRHNALRWTPANNARRRPASSVVDIWSINPSISDSHGVEGVR